RVDQAERRLEAIELKCVRGQRCLFQKLSFTIGRGELLWVHGANGSGKTSLLRLLCGLTHPDEGSVSWSGRKIRKSRDELNADLLYFGHAPAIKDDLTALENLRFACAQAGIDTDADGARAALTEFGLGVSLALMSRALSQGQKRRVGLARLSLAAAKPLWVL